jgi:hypothetical protein
MAEQRDSWLQTNWVALWAVSCFLFALLQTWKWFESHAQDAALEAVFNFAVGLAFLLIHRNRRSEEKFHEARKQLTDALEGKK